MNTFYNTLKSFLKSAFVRSEKIIIISQKEDEYDAWLGV